MGLNIKGLDMYRISQLMEVYLKEFLPGYILLPQGANLFAESVRLSYDEIEHLIPPGQKSSFNCADWFNGASGIIEVAEKDNSPKEYTVMLVGNDSRTDAFYLYLSSGDDSSMGDSGLILVKDFTRE